MKEEVITPPPDSPTNLVWKICNANQGARDLSQSDYLARTVIQAPCNIYR
jgi:hypothetical protein